MSTVLVILTNHATLGETSDANGTYAPELTHAIHQLLEAGFEYELASIHGGKAPIYGTDIEGDELNQKMLEDTILTERLAQTKVVSSLNASDYQGVYYPGGYGLLSDLATDEQAAALSAKIYENGGVIGAVCHGPAGLLPITLSNGDKLLADKTVTCFTREEEIDFETIDKIPFLLEESITRSAKQYSKVQPWVEFVISDNRVVTGQNPTSASGVGKTMAQLMK